MAVTATLLVGALAAPVGAQSDPSTEARVLATDTARCGWVTVA